MTTWRVRFEAGDYPMVCARTGQPADKLVPVEAARRATWPWFLFFVSIVAWLVSWWAVDKERIWGRLPSPPATSAASRPPGTGGSAS